jgi:hypothetical protein
MALCAEASSSTDRETAESVIARDEGVDRDEILAVAASGCYVKW